MKQSVFTKWTWCLVLRSGVKYYILYFLDYKMPFSPKFGRKMGVHLIVQM